jgi:leader peptidase (prepilin peptidase)/N-methyltransferase
MISFNIENIFVAMIGSMFGSFIGMLSYRLPLDMDIVIKRSSCTKCNNNLGILDLIPIFSWIISGGICRYCKEAVSPRYIIIEIISALLALYLYHKFSLTLIGALYFIVSMSLLLLIITDLEHYIIPDSIQIFLIFSAIPIAIILGKSFADLGMASLAGLACGLLLKFGCKLIKKQDGFGWGDVKLMLVSGSYLGLSSLPIFFFIAGIIGIITALIWRSLKKGLIFPFGPALAISMAICTMIPEIETKFTNCAFNIAAFIIKI